MILDPLSVTRVHMFIPMLPMLLSFIGGSSVPKRKRRLIQNEEGVLVDEVVIHQRQREAARKAKKEKAAKAQARRRKGKATHPNYKSMPEAEYILVRHTNWYATPRDEDIEDRGFWNEEQWGIYRDVYEPFKNPCRSMHPIDFDHICSKTYFDEAISVIEKMGLMELATIQCNYNPGLIKQFYATLVILPNPQKSMKWMSGEHECTADFSVFATLLGYAYNGETPVGRRVHNPGTKPDKDKLYVLQVLWALSMACIHSMTSLSAFSERTLLLVVVTMMPFAPHLLTSSSLLMSVLLRPTWMRTSLLM
jgi:hypothetical protein